MLCLLQITLAGVVEVKLGEKGPTVASGLLEIKLMLLDFLLSLALISASLTADTIFNWFVRPKNYHLVP